MLYCAEIIPSTEAFAAQRRLDFLLINKLEWEYSEMCGFVRARMSLAVVRSNTLLLRKARDKKTYICQRPDMDDGEVMALLALLRG